MEESDSHTGVPRLDSRIAPRASYRRSAWASRWSVIGARCWPSFFVVLHTLIGRTSMSTGVSETAPLNVNPNIPPFALPQTLMASSSLLQTSVSKLAQESLKEVKRLRVLVTRLLVAVDSTTEDTSEEDAYQGPDVDGEGKRGGTTRFGLVPSPTVTTSDNKFPYSVSRPICSGRNKELTEPMHLHKTVLQISDALDTLDQLASLMHTARMNTRMGELGLHQALSFLTTVDQLEFGGIPSSAELGDSTDPNVSVEQEPRRTSWLLDRSDAERWSNRYWERTHTILGGLLTCSVFRRSHLNSDLKRHRLDATTTRDVRADLEHLLNDIHAACPKLTITLVDGGFNLNVAHVRVADVLQCFVTFRRLHPERIIVRGLTEPMVIKLAAATGPNLTDTEQEMPSNSIEELLSKCDLSGATKDTLLSLIGPDRSPKTASDARGRRSGGAASYGRPVLTTQIGIQQLDLVTPSRFALFQRITTLAQCAILHFSNDYQPPSAVRGLFHWLHSYHDLFTTPCGRCGQLLGQDVSLPVWRSYPQLRKDDSRSIVPQHEHCQAVT
ncbi:mediator of RNA polymerase II transcription subunit 27-B [Clonorchis sinensis]|uniref:Mediator of RNA polymerase II transcription subunit 27-B n=1 Tax=Clonorchis sinensis TaxID=79923 RepID=G7Y2I5_CLOSI|nr:mediator of RNA polymerase II transcription subunit 27-B [Clonorchis sinensis]